MLTISAQTGSTWFLLILQTSKPSTKKEIVITIIKIFTDSRLWAGSVIELPCLSVCLCVCLPSWNTHFRVSRRLLVKGCISQLCLQSHNFRCFMTCDTYRFEIFGSWPPLTANDWEVSRGRSFVVAVGVSDRWQVTCDTRHVTCDTLHVTRDTWHVISSLFFSSKSF